MANNHYDGWKVGNFIRLMKLGFYEGCVIKYICRYDKKGGLEDLRKAQDYINQLIEERMEYEWQENQAQRAAASRDSEID